MGLLLVVFERTCLFVSIATPSVASSGGRSTVALIGGG